MRKRVPWLARWSTSPIFYCWTNPPTTLDFDGIGWLEALLRNWKGAAFIITHDRRFLDAVATRIVELDRGKLLSFPGNFSQWQERKAQLAGIRAPGTGLLSTKLLAQEEVWIRKGVEAPPHPQRRPRAAP